MKSKMLGRFAKLAFAVLAVGMTMTSCYDGDVENVPAPVGPSSYEVYGTVSDVDTHSGIEGATVKVGSLSATTDKDGKYSVTSTSPINGTVSATAEGYFSYTSATSVDMTAATGATKVKVDIELAVYSNHGGADHGHDADHNHDADHGHGGNENAGGGSGE